MRKKEHKKRVKFSWVDMKIHASLLLLHKLAPRIKGCCIISGIYVFSYGRPQEKIALRNERSLGLAFDFYYLFPKTF